jgi:murein DD-endopeptidase MepM/ murein hydrolase activator NlpD
MTLRIGLHTALSGASQRFNDVAAALGAEVYCWIALTPNGPNRSQDALARPNGTHILRISTPMPDEHPDDWMRHITPILDLWVSVGIPPGALIVQPGNEPDTRGVDVPQPWNVDAWLADAHQYRDALRNRYPNLPLLAPPLTSINTPEITADYLNGYSAAAIHAYWAEGNPGWRQGRDGGAAWRCATDLGVPCYVTEINSNPTSSDEILAWAHEVNSDLVLGACWFLPDAAGTEFGMYDVTPEQAATVREGLVAQPIPPRPPDPPPVSGYSGQSHPLNGVTTAAVGWSARAPREVIDAYNRNAPTIGYDPNLAIAQSALETGWWTSPAYHNRHNMAGVGITGDNVLGPTWGTIEQGVQAHLALLNCYYGDGTDPWGQLTRMGFGGFTLSKTILNDMNGVWAVPGLTYGDDIAQVANAATGGAVPDPGPQQPTPEPTPQHYQIVTPVDCPVAQGSDGGFSHGGNAPGFYAIDYGCERGTPCRASADGTVGVIYTGDWNPISARTGPSIWIDHDNGYSTFSCHMSRIDVATGGRVTQGQTIGLTGDPAIDGGFGSGAHLHWEIWDTAQHVRLRMEDLEAAGIAGPWTDAPEEQVDMKVETSFDDAELKRLWDGPKTAAQKKKAPFNKDFSIPQAWIAELTAGRPLGFAVSGEEHDAASNRTVTYFSNGKISFFPADGSVKIN